MIDLTAARLAACMPQAPAAACEAWAPAFDAAAKEFGIDTPEKMAAWLASMANESGQLNEFRERWRYSPERAAEIYGLSAEDTARYQQSRETWFEFTYGYMSRRGQMLGNTQPGDGGRYYGRGPGQITGRGNVQVASDATGIDFINHPEKLEEPVAGARAFAAYFTINHIDDIAADGSEASFLRAMKAMNSGLAEHEFRINHLQRWREVRRGLGIDGPPLDVKALQRALMAAGFDLPRFGADGDMGNETRSAIRAYQIANGLQVTGEPDAATLAKLGVG